LWQAIWDVTKTTQRCWRFATRWLPIAANALILEMHRNPIKVKRSEKPMLNIKERLVSPQWETKLRKLGLLDFEAVAKREFEWFEPPNQRRGGWSGVSRIALNPEATPEEQETGFLKIQQNHWFRARNKFFRRHLTFEREIDAMTKVAPIISFIPEVLLFGRWNIGPDAWAVIITRSLDGWFSFGDWLQGKNGLVPPDHDTLLKVFETIASTSRQLHNAGWVHLGFSAKHLFVRPKGDRDYDICLIDYEKCRRHVLPGYRTIKDCSHFMRHTPLMTDEHKRDYLKFYFQTDGFTPAHRRLIRKMPGSPQKL
jgi:lipopolysaccharide kinase (Kdo/WaaP) family protein